jgi:hypothetical protein
MYANGRPLEEKEEGEDIWMNGWTRPSHYASKFTHVLDIFHLLILVEETQCFRSWLYFHDEVKV